MSKNTMIPLTPPESIDELLLRAQGLAGKRVSMLACALGQVVPDNLFSHKGWIGDLLETALGADGGSLPLPDFTTLGVELKTIPVNQQLQPLESTFVAAIPLMTIHQETFETSSVWQKLSCVLWIPVISETNKIAERVIASPMLWQPNAIECATLKEDWEELVGLITLGELNSIHAGLGTALQVRPKGANARALCKAYDSEGVPYYTLPRGFYLRSRFTAEVLKRYYHC